MNPDNLPSNTEYAYAHFYQPHPYLFTQSAFGIKPIRPLTQTIRNIDLAEYQSHPDEPSLSSRELPVAPPKRGRGRPKKPK